MFQLQIYRIGYYGYSGSRGISWWTWPSYAAVNWPPPAGCK